MLPIMTGTGRLTDDVALKFSANGVAIASISLAFNARKRDDQGNWVDGDVYFVRGTAFKQMAECAAESLSRGMEVVVSGRLKTDQWEDKQTGEKRSAPSLLIDSIGPNLAFATARVNRVDRSQAGGAPSQPQDNSDPWAATATADESAIPF
jgi:single-strand DNA-binding protein